MTGVTQYRKLKKIFQKKIGQKYLNKIFGVITGVIT